MRVLHARIEGITASFRYPLVVSGKQLSMPVPGYSTLLGLLSAFVGEEVLPEETRVGFEYSCEAIATDLEKTVRWTMQKGRLIPHKKGPGIVEREFHINPRLDLYLTNLQLRKYLESPIAPLVLGRSQDIAWVKFVREINLEPCREGYLGPTMIPLPQPEIPGIYVVLAEWYDNAHAHRFRRPSSIRPFIAMFSDGKERICVRKDDLFRPSDNESRDNVIYLHRWLT